MSTQLLIMEHKMYVNCFSTYELLKMFIQKSIKLNRNSKMIIQIVIRVILLHYTYCSTQVMALLKQGRLLHITLFRESFT